MAKELIDVDAPASNGVSPETVATPQQRPLKDYSDDELVTLRKQLIANSRQVSADLTLVCGVLIGRGHDIEPE